MNIKNIKMSEGNSNPEFPPLELISESGWDDSVPLSNPVEDALRVKTITYPANRFNLYEQLTYDLMLDSMYKDNTIFTAYELRSRKREDLFGQMTGTFSGSDNYGVNMKSSANILMPRSDTDIEEHNHEFVTAEQSLMSRGNNEVLSAIGSGIATMASEVVENITKGYFTDRGEAIGTPTRATYKGADHRTKTYTWRLTPRNPQDLQNLLLILRVFAISSYGVSNNASEVNKLVDTVNGLIRESMKFPAGADGRGFRGIDLTIEAVTNSFRYVKVMSNPTLWYIRNYNHNALGQIDTSIFGPANIVNMKVNRTPTGKFQGLAMFPNLSAHYDIEITFREALSHTRDTVQWVL